MSTNRLKLNPEKMELMWSGSRCSLRKLGGRGPAKAQHWLRQGQRSCTIPLSYHAIWYEPWETYLSRSAALQVSLLFHLKQIRLVRQSLNAAMKS